MRRGRYGDAGGVANSGELPRAEPVAVASEEQLQREVEAIAAALTPATEWTQRVEALLRLEGLVLGGAAAHPTFPEALLAARGPLANQVLERRSAVSRQACHALAVVAEACSYRVEALAVQLLPALLKAIAMGIQVVTDAADACARALVRYCHAPKVLPRLCSTVTGDRNGKLRQCASSYLLQALEEWDPSLLDKHTEAIEAAILAAAQDAQSDTRAAGRLMFAVYGSTWPAPAAAMLQRVEKDRALQEKLHQALEAYRPSLLESDSSGSLSRRSSFGHAGTLQRLGSAPSGGARPAPKPLAVVPRLALSSLTVSGSSSPTASMPNSARLAAAPPTGLTPRAVRQPPATARVPPVGALQQEGENQRPNSGAAGGGRGTDRLEGGSKAKMAARKSMGGAALRINIAALAQEQSTEEGHEYSPCGGGQVAAAAPAALSSARRVAAPQPPVSARARRASALPLQGVQAFYSRPDSARRVEAEQSSIAEGSDTGSELAPSSSMDERQPHSLALGQLLGQLGKPGTPWLDRVQLFGALGEALAGGGSNPHPDVMASAERVVACLLDGTGDAHFKVAAAALEALTQGLAGRNAKVFEPQLDRLMPALFLRTADAKEAVKQLAAGALAEVPRRHAPDAVLAALAKSLALARAAKVKVAVLDYFSAAATGSLCPNLEEGLELGAGAPLRALVGGMLGMALDKNADIRRAAVRALGVVYAAEQGQAVVSAIQALPPNEGAAVQRALEKAVPSLQADLAAALRASRPAPVTGAGSVALHTASSSRRNSGEGLLQLPQLPPALLSVRAPPPVRVAPAGPVPAPRSAKAAAGTLNSPRSGALSSPRSSTSLASPRAGSPGLWGDTSPTHSSSSLSRLGRQASGLMAATAESSEPLSRQPSSCVNHTSSPKAAHPTLSRTGSLASGAAASRAAAAAGAEWSPLGRSGSGSQQAEARAEAPAVPAPAASASSMADLAPFDDIMEGQLCRLLAQLEGGPSAEAFQGLSRLAHVLPPSAWAPHFGQVLAAVLAALGAGSGPLLREAGVMLVQDLAEAQAGLFAAPLPVLLPKLLDCCVDASREVAVAADGALGQLLGSLPPQAGLVLLTARLPQASAQLSADPHVGGLLYTALKGLRRLLQRLPATEAERVLLPDLLPGLCTAYCSPIADVRKATVDCLVALWLAVGDALVPHLGRLSSSQLKLLTIYRDKGLTQPPRLGAT